VTNTLCKDAIFKLGADRKPLDPDSDLASAPTFSRLGNAATTRDAYRIAKAFLRALMAANSAFLGCYEWHRLTHAVLRDTCFIENALDTLLMVRRQTIHPGLLFNTCLFQSD